MIYVVEKIGNKNKKLKVCLVMLSILVSRFQFYLKTYVFDNYLYFLFFIFLETFQTFLETTKINRLIK